MRELDEADIFAAKNAVADAGTAARLDAIALPDMAAIAATVARSALAAVDRAMTAAAADGVAVARDVADDSAETAAGAVKADRVLLAAKVRP